MAEYYTSLSQLAEGSERFCKVPEETVVSDQLRDRYKVMKEVGQFNDFVPVNEEALEDWVDIQARRVKSRRVCVELFQELWCASATEAVADTIAHEVADDYEVLVSSAVQHQDTTYCRRTESFS
eukprot:GHVQ01039222.1.p1 GENE.GHVQ01039222.1~~GHVQ01039222.1.p1  ORF type:complete len:124 (-),score=17.21 GHVQ01039222.1:258-629(-)